MYIPGPGSQEELLQAGYEGNTWIDIIDDAWRDLVREGVLEQDSLDTFNMPGECFQLFATVAYLMRDTLLLSNEVRFEGDFLAQPRTSLTLRVSENARRRIQSMSEVT